MPAYLLKWKKDKKFIIFLMVVIFLTIGFYVFSSSPKLTKVTITGNFTGTKGCMGVVNRTLLTDFANNCEEAEKYLYKNVEVTGYIYEPDCPTDPPQQCFYGSHMKNIESIKIIE